MKNTASLRCRNRVNAVSPNLSATEVRPGPLEAGEFNFGRHGGNVKAYRPRSSAAVPAT
ncbi:Uncharacterised protein [Mycobacteroides abscessus]|nr:Uncharacterised protein [Mycobacteroides abscessus]